MKRIPVIMIASLFVIGIPAITQSDPVPKKNGNKYVLYEKRTDNGAVCHHFKAQQAKWMFGKTDGKGYTVSLWCMAHGRNQRKPEITRGIQNE